MSFECKKLVHVHFLKQALLPCNACEVRCIDKNLLTLRSYIAPYCASATLCNFRGVASSVRYLEAKMHGGAPFGAKILSAVRNGEASASRRLLMYYSYGSFNP